MILFYNIFSWITKLYRRFFFCVINRYSCIDWQFAFFSFNPSEYTVVLDDRLDEARIYTPVLKTKFNLWLRDSDTLQSYNGFETGIIGKKAESYAKSLEKIAQEREVKFKKLGLPQSL